MARTLYTLCRRPRGVTLGGWQPQSRNGMPRAAAVRHFQSRLIAGASDPDFAWGIRKLAECEGHESTSGPAGVSVYCNGTCRAAL